MSLVLERPHEMLLFCKPATGSQASCPARGLTRVCRAVSADEHRRPAWKVRRRRLRRQRRAAPGFSRRPPVTLVRSRSANAGGGVGGPPRWLLYAAGFFTSRCARLPEVTTGGGVSLRGGGGLPSGTGEESAPKPLCSIRGACDAAGQRRRRAVGCSSRRAR